jgi:hypothetical protein
MHDKIISKQTVINAATKQPKAAKTVKSAMRIRPQRPSQITRLEQILEAAEADHKEVISLIPCDIEKYNKFVFKPTDFVNPIDDKEFCETVLGICFQGLMDIASDKDGFPMARMSAIQTLLNRTLGPVTRKKDTESVDDNELLTKLITLMNINREDLTRAIKEK